MKKSNYQSPLNIPKGKSGSWAIKHKIVPAFEKITIVSERTALFQGLRPQTAVFDTPQRYHYLTCKGGTIMSDVPQEQFDHAYIVEKMHGKVLIGGLGLGYVATLCDQKKSIGEIIVVEDSIDVVSLVWKHLNLSKGDIRFMDIYKFLKMTNEKFDYIYLDIWATDSESTLYEDVIPLRKLAMPLVKSRDRIICWREETMRNQIAFALSTNLAFPELYKQMMNIPDKKFKKIIGRFDKAKYPFWNWIRTKKIRPQKAKEKIKKYVELYGESEWEKEWGKWRIK